MKRKSSINEKEFTQNNKENTTHHTSRHRKAITFLTAASLFVACDKHNPNAYFMWQGNYLNGGIIYEFSRWSQPKDKMFIDFGVWTWKNEKEEYFAYIKKWNGKVKYLHAKTKEELKNLLKNRCIDDFYGLIYPETEREADDKINDLFIRLDEYKKDHEWDLKEKADIQKRLEEIDLKLSELKSEESKDSKEEKKNLKEEKKNLQKRLKKLNSLKRVYDRVDDGKTYYPEEFDFTWN